MNNGLNCGLECGIGDSVATNEPPGMNIYASIATLAGNGANNLGDISTFLLNLGLGVEAARTALTTVANNAGTSPQQLAAINAELNYINSGAYAASSNKTNTALLVLLGLGALYLVMRDR